MDEFIYNMRNFIKGVTTDQNVTHEVENMITSFALSYSIYNKFVELWKDAGI